MRGRLESASRRIHEKTGREVEVTAWERDGLDDRNNPTWTRETITATGEVVPRGTPNFDSRIDGADADVDAAILLPADLGVPVTTGGSERGATEVTDVRSDTTYTITNVYHETNTGKIEAHGEA